MPQLKLGQHLIERGLTHTGENWERVLLDENRVLIHRIVEGPNGWLISTREHDSQSFPYHTNRGLTVKDVARVLCPRPLSYYTELKAVALELWSEAELLEAMGNYYESCHDEWKALLPSLSIKYTATLWDFLKGMANEHTDCGIIFKFEDYCITGELLVNATLRVVYEAEARVLVFIYHDACDYQNLRIETVLDVAVFAQLLLDEDKPFSEVFFKCKKYNMLKAGILKGYGCSTLEEVVND